MNETSNTRRDFLKSSAGLAGASAVAANLSMLANVHAAGNDVIRVGVVGCGGRGSGAIEQCLQGGPNVRLVAMGDAFRDRLDACHARLMNNQAIRNNVEVPENRRFVGLDAYQHVIDSADLVILATPPGFRPEQIRATIAARKHLFTEKPVAVDGPGVRTVLAAFEQANQNNLTVVAGLQRRYQNGYLESMRRIHGGEFGNITAARCHWNQGGLWHRDRTATMSDLEWQLRNWLYFTWLSGDHIVEQHVHNIDVVRWAMNNANPVKAVGLGGRQVRTGPQYGHIFDHFAINFEFPGGIHVLSTCRQIEGCERNVSEAIVTSRGTWTGEASRRAYEFKTFGGETTWSISRREDNVDPYQQEHVELLRSIRGQRDRINDLKSVADSTLSAIMGRMSAYTGQIVTWEQALNSRESLVPQRLTWEMSLPVPPVAVPGTTPLL